MVAASFVETAHTSESSDAVAASFVEYHFLCIVCCALNMQGGEKIRTAEVWSYEYEPPSEPIQFMTDYLAKRHETVQVRRYEYEPLCPPPPVPSLDEMA